jgi:hypothetical protein
VQRLPRSNGASARPQGFSLISGAIETRPAVTVDALRVSSAQLASDLLIAKGMTARGGLRRVARLAQRAIQFIGRGQRLCC